MVDAVEIERAIGWFDGATLTNDDFAALVEAYRRYVGAEGLALDEAGLAWLTVDADVELCLFHLPHFPGIAAGARLPEAARGDERVLRRLLQANASWIQTQGGSFGIFPSADEPMLCRIIPLPEPDPELLDHHLATFVAVVQSWHEEIASLLETGSWRSPDTAHGIHGGEGWLPPRPTMIRV
ncbi:MAG: type III secretion system chaperone [Pseudomonadota bacterium]